MARSRKCRCCDGWHSLEEPWPFECMNYTPKARSDLPAPMVISDHLPDLQSQLNGQVFDSKSALRQHYKAHGVVELGTDAPREPVGPSRPQVTKQEIADALNMVKAGYKPSVPDEPAEVAFD